LAFGEFQGLDLRRVIIARAKQRGTPVQVLALEFYEAGVIVRWIRPGGFAGPESPEEAVGPDEGGSMMISDDRETPYKQAGMQSGGDRGVTYFVPATPDDATRISVTTQTGQVEFPLK